MNIPEDIIFHLYSFLQDKELLKASATCRAWHNVAMDDSVCIKFFLDKIYQVLTNIGRARATTLRGDGTKLTVSHIDTPSGWINLYKDLGKLIPPIRIISTNVNSIFGLQRGMWQLSCRSN